MRWHAIRGIGLAMVLMVGLGACTGAESEDGNSPPSATVVTPPSSDTAPTTDVDQLADALLTPDEVLSALGEGGSTSGEVSFQGQSIFDLDWVWKTCVDPQLMPEWQAGVTFDLIDMGLETGFVQGIAVAEPEALAATFGAFQAVALDECHEREAPAVKYQPASLGDDAVAWELYGGPTNVDRVVVIRDADVLTMIWVLRGGAVPDGMDLTREQVDAVAAAAVDKLP